LGDPRARDSVFGRVLRVAAHAGFVSASDVPEELR
jgi:hypothetical protein